MANFFDAAGHPHHEHPRQERRRESSSNDSKQSKDRRRVMEGDGNGRRRDGVRVSASRCADSEVVRVAQKNKIRHSDSGASRSSNPEIKGQLLAMKQNQRAGGKSLGSKPLSHSSCEGGHKNNVGLSIAGSKKRNKSDLVKSLGESKKRRRLDSAGSEDSGSAVPIKNRRDPNRKEGTSDDATKNDSSAKRKKVRTKARDGSSDGKSGNIPLDKKKKTTVSSPSGGAPRRKQQGVGSPAASASKASSGAKSKKRELKPLLKVGDAVHAAWWPDTESRRSHSCSCWYAGKIKAMKEVDRGGEYGPVRYYSIDYHDGDELEHVKDVFVSPKADYLLATGNRQEMWFGVKNVFDENSSDEWAREVGWHVASCIDGKEQTFSLLSEALRAYDDSVVDEMGEKTRPSHLNLPNEWEFGVAAFQGSSDPTSPIHNMDTNEIGKNSTTLPKADFKKKKHSNFLGVSYSKKKYISYIRNEKRRIRLGAYILETDAALSYDVAMRLLKYPNEMKNLSTLQDYERAKKCELERTGLGIEGAMTAAAIESKVNAILSKQIGTVSVATEAIASRIMKGGHSAKETMLAPPKTCPEIVALNDAMAKKWGSYLPSETGKKFLDSYQKSICKIIQDMKPKNVDAPVPSTVSLGNEISHASISAKDSNEGQSYNTDHLKIQARDENPEVNVLDADKAVAVQKIDETASRGGNKLNVSIEKSNKSNEVSTQKLGLPLLSDRVPCDNLCLKSDNKAPLASIHAKGMHTNKSKKPEQMELVDHPVPSAVSVGNEPSDMSFTTKDSKKGHGAKTDHLQIEARNENPGVIAPDADKVIAAQKKDETVSCSGNKVNISMEKPNQAATSNQVVGPRLPSDRVTYGNPRPKSDGRVSLSSMNSKATHAKKPKKTELLELTVNQVEGSDMQYPIGCAVWFQFDKINGLNIGDNRGQSFRTGVITAVFVDLLSRDIIYKVKLVGQDMRSEMIPEHELHYAPRCPVSISPSPSVSRETNTNTLQGQILMCRTKSHHDINTQVVLQLKESLLKEQALLSNISDDYEKLLDILIQLANAHMDRPILAETFIGKSISSLKSHGNRLVAQRARELVKKWKGIAIVQKDQACNSHDDAVKHFYTVLITKKGNQFHVEDNVSSERVKYRKVSKVGVEENESSNSTITTATGLC